MSGSLAGTSLVAVSRWRLCAFCAGPRWRQLCMSPLLTECSTPSTSSRAQPKWKFQADGQIHSTPSLSGHESFSDPMTAKSMQSIGNTGTKAMGGSDRS